MPHGLWALVYKDDTGTRRPTVARKGCGVSNPYADTEVSGVLDQGISHTRPPGSNPPPTTARA